jgi:hypothetical protein
MSLSHFSVIPFQRLSTLFWSPSSTKPASYQTWWKAVVEFDARQRTELCTLLIVAHSMREGLRDREVSALPRVYPLSVALTSTGNGQ